MPNRNVRAHARRKPSGGYTNVTRHSRWGAGGKKRRRALLTPRHAWQLIKRANRASRRKKTVLAVVLGVLGLTEFAAWLTVSGLTLVLLTFAVLAGAVGSAAAAAVGIRS